MEWEIVTSPIWRCTWHELLESAWTCIVCFMERYHRLKEIYWYRLFGDSISRFQTLGMKEVENLPSSCCCLKCNTTYCSLRIHYSLTVVPLSPCSSCVSHVVIEHCALERCFKPSTVLSLTGVCLTLIVLAHLIWLLTAKFVMFEFFDFRQQT